MKFVGSMSSRNAEGELVDLVGQRYSIFGVGGVARLDTERLEDLEGTWPVIERFASCSRRKSTAGSDDAAMMRSDDAAMVRSDDEVLMRQSREAMMQQ